MATPDKPLEQMTAQERLKFGTSLYKDGKFDEAIAVWSKITRDDKNHKAYARAQFNLGFVYDAQNKLDQAIESWSKVRHSDDPKAYARAQNNLGIVYKDQGKLEQAIKT